MRQTRFCSAPPNKRTIKRFLKDKDSVLKEMRKNKQDKKLLRSSAEKTQINLIELLEKYYNDDLFKMKLIFPV